MSFATRISGTKTGGLLYAGTIALSIAFTSIAAQAQSAPATAASSAQAIVQGQRVFIAGHSFNVFICAPLDALANEAGLRGHTTFGVQFIGNSTPMQHWNQGTEETNIAKAALRTGKLDVFTLSPNATMPEEAIDKFADLAQQTNPSIRLLVQQSWAAWDGNAPNIGSFAPGAAGAGRRPPSPPPAATAATSAPQFPQGCPPARGPRAGTPGTAARRPAEPAAAVNGSAPAAASSGFTNTDRDKFTAADISKGRDTGASYTSRIRSQLQGINTRHKREMAFLVPAAEAVNRLREHVIAGKVPGVSKQSELFADAMGHAGPVLSDLVSYVWFASIYQRSPTGMTALDKENTEASKARHLLLQQIAWQSVLDEPMSAVHR